MSKTYFVVGPTSIVFENLSSSDKLNGIEGQDMTIKCTAVGGQPAPDVKLVILGSTYTGTQSAEHTFIPNKSNDGSTVTCKAGYNQISYNPIKTMANIYLMCKYLMLHINVMKDMKTSNTLYGIYSFYNKM